ncbi:hypothetical protein GBAR_LOCUS30551 [Geodia barretti]|uniref:Calcineurin-like phosphoesterase domain-containing protein n=1 Tax=Geodia barretti TaxID=519541 RepID=A0AA35XLR0_GEOBA|nr:hypothetical protein GBAR_LOCUS30551 [Geodia barretti]
MELVILHVTDIHNALERVEQLKSWLASGNHKLDVVLISGDIANAPMDWNLTAEQEEQYQKDLQVVVDSFTSVKSRVYFIPGNHDVLPVFKVGEDSPPLVPSNPPFPCNMHMKRTTIAPNLHLLGLGGSVPGYQGGEMIWEGFPYRNYSEMDSDVHKLLDPVFFEDTSCLAANDAVILMTHVGPAESDTSYIREDPQKPIVSGNKELMKLIATEKMQRHCVLNIHGHSHFSPGQCVVGKTRILNPGPLQDGCYGLYTLRQRAGHSPSWEVASVCFHTLPSTS